MDAKSKGDAMAETIRRNAHSKIRRLARGAVDAKLFNHSGPEGPRKVEDVDAALEHWFAWTRQGCGRANLRTGAIRFVEGEARRQTILTLAYHSNLELDLVLADEPAPEVPR